MAFSYTTLQPEMLWSCILLSGRTAGARTFHIEQDRFVKDGEPVQLISGSFHYHRFLPAYWKERLEQIRALGCNTIQTLVPWNFHERRPGQYHWQGDSDLDQFLSLASDLGLNVMLRPGPYICGEWDFGGFPWWLADPKAVPGGGQFTLRSNDSAFLLQVDRWWAELLPRIRPFLHANGGPIVMLQLENELGFANEGRHMQDYLRHLYKAARKHLGQEVLIYTTDPPPNVEKGSLMGEDVFTAVDFGPGWYDLDYAFGQQRKMNAPGKSAPMCTEFYTGWLTSWGEAMANTSFLPLNRSADPTHDLKYFIGSLNAILRYGNNSGSVNFYMAAGGTNCGWWQGGGGEYNSIITSYDYDAPISEAGDYGQPGIGGFNKFKLVREAISAYLGKQLPPIPPRPAIHAYGTVQLSAGTPLLSQLTVLSAGISTELPLPMELCGQGGGLIAYRTQLSAGALHAGANLSLGAPVHDFATVLVNGRSMGRLERVGNTSLVLEEVASSDESSADSPHVHDGAVLDIIVEAMGRDNGAWAFDVKGLPSQQVLLDGQAIRNWTAFPLPLDNMHKLDIRHAAAADPPLAGPAFHRGQLHIDEALRSSSTGRLPDSYLALQSWGKGVAFVNGFNLGWYWPSKGPAETMYLPGAVLHAGANDLVLLEIERVPEDHTVSLVAEPSFFGPKGNGHGCGRSRNNLNWNTMLAAKVKLDVSSKFEELGVKFWQNR
ncbi:hypothetical protein WJX73_010761 [Symbiochloris irregularis]|uniref:beta-galactosidase n=1 Tax=Symbiochloris irregularis TaxID=706552 RepID=A0AAW1NK77_9CHLO